VTWQRALERNGISKRSDKKKTNNIMAALAWRRSKHEKAKRLGDNA